MSQDPASTGSAATASQDGKSLRKQKLQAQWQKFKAKAQVSARRASVKTKDRLSLDGQLRQARVSLERYIAPQVFGRAVEKDQVIPRWVLQRARGIVFLTVVKAGFLFAGNVGTGCVIVRDETGTWSGPSSIGLLGVSFGLLAGATKVDYIIILRDDRSVKQFTSRGQLRIGGELQLAAGPVGRSVEGSVGAGDKGVSALFSYSHAKGLYGALALDGLAMGVRPDCNAAFYGRRVSVAGILSGDVACPHNDDHQAITELLVMYNAGDELEDLVVPALEEEDEEAGVELDRTIEEEKELEEAVTLWEDFVETPEFQDMKQEIQETIVEESKDQELRAEEYVAVTPENAEAVAAATREAEAFTKKLEQTPASGREDDRETLLRVLLASYKAEGRDCLFFDSSTADQLAKEGAKHLTATRNAKGEAKSVLKLESPSGLAGVKDKSEEEAAVELQTAIRSERSHPALTDIRQRLARAYGVEANRIHITGVHLGTFNVDFVIEDCPDYFRNGAVVGLLEEQFDQFMNLKVHPLLVKKTFEVSDFDERGHKSFASERSPYQVGPPGRQKTYTQPTGWCRYGLKVLGKFGDDTWLHPFQHPNNWYRAFHGTSADFGKTIVASRFNPGRGQGYRGSPCANRPGNVGVGIYCSPNPITAEGYSTGVQGDGETPKECTINTTAGPQTYRFMFQCGVDPDVVRIPQGAPDIWVVPSAHPEAIRPYGLLLKKTT